MKIVPKEDGVRIQGARENNLKSINVFIPRNKMTVVTGLSGSGKSSLVFDTIYAEGQRRYIESLSAYARRFMDQMKLPDVDSILGLSPVVAIDQKTISSNPRSTIGTVTEIYDYLRLLFAKLGTPYCPDHEEPLKKTSLEKIAKVIFKGSFRIYAPVIRNKKVDIGLQVKRYMEMGFLRGKINGRFQLLDQVRSGKKGRAHSLDIMIDQLSSDKNSYSQTLKSLEWASRLADGFIKVEHLSQGKNSSESFFSLKGICSKCLYSAPEIEPKLFSFNSAVGACPECGGLGYLDEEQFLEEDGDSLNICSSCQGKRIKKSALSVFIGGKNIYDLSDMDLEDLESFLKKARFPSKYKVIADNIIQKILYDLELLKKVGVSYLQLNRSTRSLSGGEAQRIRLASQVSSVLRGVLYILDEPSIGLHPSDSSLLLDLIQQIKKRSNTIVVVEHDEETIRRADHVIDIGPQAGNLGGHLVGQGSLKNIIKNKKSLTGDYLAKRKCIILPEKRRKAKKPFLEILGARGNNLKNINLKLPLNSFCCVTGVSGSGKSSLIVDTLYKAFNKMKGGEASPLPFKKMLGTQHVDKIILVDQSPIGRNSRSVPATYIGVMSFIRQFMSYLPASRIRGYTPSHFSFNIKGGRCDYCEGAGNIVQEMHFMPPVEIPCEMCQGKRYSQDILNICYKDKNISDILNMTVREACMFFKNHPHIYHLLKTLEEVGLSYLTLGQSSSDLSGGEAQRIKLTRELSKKKQKHTLYILDEPTTGLHFEDIKKLLNVLNSLVDKGHTVVVIEHQLDVIKCADYVIDLGPQGGKKGGYIVGSGPPEKIAGNKKSLTGLYLKKVLGKKRMAL